MAIGKTIEIDLGAQRADVERRIESGDYNDASDVVREALHALDERDAVMDDILRADVKASMANTKPGSPIDDVFKRVRARIAQVAKERSREG